MLAPPSLFGWGYNPLPPGFRGRDYDHKQQTKLHKSRQNSCSHVFIAFINIRCNWSGLFRNLKKKEEKNIALLHTSSCNSILQVYLLRK